MAVGLSPGRCVNPELARDPWASYGRLTIRRGAPIDSLPTETEMTQIMVEWVDGTLQAIEEEQGS